MSKKSILSFLEVGKSGSDIHIHRYPHVGQWGTHVDPPAHFVRGMRMLDQIEVKEMILSLVVIDIYEEFYVLSTNHYQIELLTKLDQVPELGALIVGTFPKPKNGTGFPARVFAILP